MNFYGPTATFIFGTVFVLGLLVALALIVRAVSALAFGSTVEPAELRTAVMMLWAVALGILAHKRLSRSGTEGSE